MAYMSQENKAKLVALAKPILKKYGIKATFGVDNHRGIVCNIKSGKIDLIGNYRETVGSNHYQADWARTEASKATYIQVNPYHFNNHFSGKAQEFIAELMKALYTGNHDNSDIQSDYFDVGWYVYVNIGKWDKPYEVEK